jgi:hypothetical protein
MTTFDVPRVRSQTDRPPDPAAANDEEQIVDEARQLEREGTHVVLLSPELQERQAFPRNFLDVDDRGPIMRRAARAVERRLRGGVLTSLLASRVRPVRAVPAARAA